MDREPHDQEGREPGDEPAQGEPAAPARGEPAAPARGEPRPRGADVNPYARPAAQAEPGAPRPQAPGSAGPAKRIAGGLLIANAILVMMWLVVAPPEATKPGEATFTGPAGAVPAIIDVFIGLSLLRGSARLASWAMLRCFGGVMFALAFVTSKPPIETVTQIVLSGSLLALLAGEAGRARAAIGTSAAGLCLLLSLAGTAATAVGGNPLGSLFLSLSGDIEPSPVKQVSGRGGPYELTFPDDRWHRRKQAAAARDNPSADQWFVRPDKDAHIMIIAEHVKDKWLPIDAYTDAVAGNLRKNAPDAKILPRERWPRFPDTGRLLSASATQNGTPIEYRYATLTAHEWAYCVVGFAGKDNMAAVEAEIRSVFDTLTLPDKLMSAVPAEFEPEPVKELRGPAIPYLLRPPGDRWHVRKASAFKAENSVIDQWISRPDLDAHVFVVAEEIAAGQVVPVESFANVVVENAKKNTTRFEVVRREPWAKFPGAGIRIRLSLTRDGIDLEYDYGVYAAGRYAFQITASTGRAGFAYIEEELARAVDSFEPPP